MVVYEEKRGMDGCVWLMDLTLKETKMPNCVRVCACVCVGLCDVAVSKANRAELTL